MYAALMTTVTLLAATRIFGITPWLGWVFALAALGAAFAVARSDGRFDRPVAILLALSIAVWTLSVGGQLYQRYGESSDELRILIDPLRMGVALASDALLAVAALALRGAMSIRTDR